ncbi:MAG: glycosyltransferase family 9 protein [Ignavibacteriales bacterium]|nr:glycosyltransferase family 9 protein [Ignavibacteriales bacterium]
MIPLKTDCRFFRGDVPCRPHKRFGVHCVDESGASCLHYEHIDKNILIIKLGAIGDVIRTTPLLHKLKAEYPSARIWWLTLTPEILPSLVDEPLGFSLKNIVSLRSLHFDVLYNLDKDREACALCEQISATTKRGFRLRDGIIAPIDAAADGKYLTGIFDDLSQANKKSYPEEIFEICGFSFAGERYILDRPASATTTWKINKRKRVVGLNTGCGGRWTSRLWDDKNWVAVARALKKKGYEVVLLGGEQEHSKNQKLARASKAKYFGHYPLQQFIELVDRCDLVVTGVTMAMHITIGLGKKIVLFNNIFNKHEFELYGLGSVLEPDKPCRCFYQPTCTNSRYRCMEHLPVTRVVDACARLLRS